MEATAANLLTLPLTRVRCAGDPVFQLLLSIHNTIQRVQCFQCPPPALCTDARDLVQEVNTSVYSVHVYTVQS